MKLGIKFNLPFRFLDEGDFEFKVEKTTVKIKTKLVQNFEGAKNIMGMQMETSGEGSKVDMNVDHHGLINYTNIKMEISDESDCTMECFHELLGFNFELVTKITCMQFLNRLTKVVRHVTNNFWIGYINLRDIVNFQIFDLSVDPPMMNISFIPGHGYDFPNFRILEQTSMKTEIDEILKEQIKIPIWKNIFLDSINYYTINRYNESVISANIALESFVAEYLYNKLNQKYPGKEQENREKIIRLPKSLHAIMKKHFPEIDGRNFHEEEKLWKKFDHIRVNVRTRAMHSFTMELNDKIACNTIYEIREIIKWIDPTVNLGDI